MLTLNFTPFPTITTERLILRQLTMDDINDLFWLRSNELVGKYIPRPPYKSVDEASAFIPKIDTNIANNESILWGITLKNENKIIGTICLWNIHKEHYRGEVGYELHPDFWNRGIMQESLVAIINYGFQDMKLHSIEAVINPDNAATIKLLERNHFVKEAHFKENFFHKNSFQDTVIYSLLNKV